MTDNDKVMRITTRDDGRICLSITADDQHTDLVFTVFAAKQLRKHLKEAIKRISEPAVEALKTGDKVRIIDTTRHGCWSFEPTNLWRIGDINSIDEDSVTLTLPDGTVDSGLRTHLEAINSTQSD